jgi:DNA-binding response OmpR family regulator
MWLWTTMGNSAASSLLALLLDVGLPGMDGYEVARQLRADAGRAKTIILMMSGCGSAEDRRRSEQAGCDGYLIKPVDLAALQAFLSGRTQASNALRLIGGNGGYGSLAPNRQALLGSSAMA